MTWSARLSTNLQMESDSSYMAIQILKLHAHHARAQVQPQSLLVLIGSPTTSAEVIF